jgi:hypothetical protein
VVLFRRSKRSAPNLYTYVGNDPLNWSDPLGLTPTTIPGINCLGYACGIDSIVGPGKNESFQNTMFELGWNCWKVDNLADCWCDDGYDTIIVYIVIYQNNRNGLDPWKDNWIFDNQNEWHAARQDGPGNWSWIKNDWSPDDGVARPKPQSGPDPAAGAMIPPMSAYCCCKCHKS